ncbi:MAG: hypothetical protein LBH10_01860 [Burkholderiaceae bacterium]|jgi:hypothetical protein|nr:hypothetical protein [Burkholderiaceae bacterium]
MPLDYALATQSVLPMPAPARTGRAQPVAGALDLQATPWGPNSPVAGEPAATTPVSITAQ